MGGRCPQRQKMRRTRARLLKHLDLLRKLRIEVLAVKSECRPPWKKETDYLFVTNADTNAPDILTIRKILTGEHQTRFFNWNNQSTLVSPVIGDDQLARNFFPEFTPGVVPDPYQIRTVNSFLVEILGYLF